jgi:hypothetical protein
MPGTEDILKKYEQRLKQKVSLEEVDLPSNKEFSKEYEKFRGEALSRKLTFYESLSLTLGKILNIAPKQKEREEIERAIEAAHLRITPVGATSFALFISFLITITAIFLGLIYYFLTEELMIFLPILMVLGAAFALKPLSKIPIYLANKWRLRASNQMVLCILYVVMYMHHTSNLEHAIKFAAQHIGPPLSLDLRKIFWDVETGRYSTIKESLDLYLAKWRNFNQEFVTSFHLIESSLYEPSEQRRLQLLDKAIEVMLEGTYEKMLHYAQNLKSPITMLHMLGVILPILGLVVFPLIGAFLGGLIKWYHLAFLYNLVLPIFVYVLGMNILAKRPTGYGETPVEKAFLRVKKPYGAAIFFALLICLIGFLPLIIHTLDPTTDFEIAQFGKFLDYRGNKGPFGIGALILSLFIPLGLASGFSIYYKTKTSGLIKIRQNTIKLEKEFASSLFQLGNRIGDGVPPELAFATVAKNMEGTPTGNFFRLVTINIRNLGMNLKQAIFNPKTGAILSYPSSLIESSMEILIESSKKGSQIVAQALTSISTYVSRIHQVNERLKDLLADIISSMKSQISFLTPIIAGIVVGISSMIVTILGSLGTMFERYSAEATEGVAGFGNLATMVDLFRIQNVIPSFYFQLIVGIYVVQLIYILTKISSGIENGPDRLTQEYRIGKNMMSATLLYLIVSLAVILIFNLLASTILQSTFTAAAPV